MFLTFDIVILVIILFTTVSQSIFGVGLLLWGTPLLIIYGLEYSEILLTLLPISIAINILQIIPNLNFISFVKLRRFIIFSLPPMALSLTLIVDLQLNVSPFVMVALLVSALLRLYPDRTKKIFHKYNDVLLPALGLVHGVSNLGGSLLVIWVANQSKHKYENRTTVAICYLILASLQLTLLYAVSEQVVISTSAVYLPCAIIIYLFCTKYMFATISEKAFSKLITGLMLAIGAVMLLTQFYEL